MDIATTRFGTVTIEEVDVMTFSDGLIGMEECRQWALLADSQNDALGWMQCLDRPEVALAVVSPRRFVPDYRVRVARRDVEPLGLNSVDDAQVLVILNQVEDCLVLNLKAPLVLYTALRIGRQIVAKDDHAVQHPIQGALKLRRAG